MMPSTGNIPCDVTFIFFGKEDVEEMLKYLVSIFKVTGISTSSPSFCALTHNKHINLLWFSSSVRSVPLTGGRKFVVTNQQDVGNSKNYKSHSLAREGKVEDTVLKSLHSLAVHLL